jgi:hypothetical protein
MDHVLGFLEVSGCFLLWVTYLVVLRAVAHAKRPDPQVDAHALPPVVPQRRDDRAGVAAKSVA